MKTVILTLICRDRTDGLLDTLTYPALAEMDERARPVWSSPQTFDFPTPAAMSSVTDAPSLVGVLSAARGQEGTNTWNLFPAKVAEARPAAQVQEQYTLHLGGRSVLIPASHLIRHAEEYLRSVRGEAEAILVAVESTRADKWITLVPPGTFARVDKAAASGEVSALLGGPFQRSPSPVGGA